MSEQGSEEKTILLVCEGALNGTLDTRNISLRTFSTVVDNPKLEIILSASVVATQSFEAAEML